MRLILILIALLTAGTPALAQTPKRPVILIGIDGFRADYLQRGITPNLSRLAAEGVTAEGGMRPSFPTVTFPNFYTLATGLHPDHHGLVYNAMRDPSLPGRTFTLGNRAEVMDRVWWDAAEPIWVTAERQGLRTATMFWPGSEAAIRGVRPTYWVPFEQTVPSAARVNIVLGWHTLPPEERPHLTTLYFDIVDGAGHRFGPDAPETLAAMTEVDTAIGALLKGLADRNITADLVIVADHGMAAISSERVVMLDEVIPADTVDVLALGPVAMLDIRPGQARGARNLFRNHPHMTCRPKGELPARLVYGSNPRIPGVVCIAESGWMIGLKGRTDPTTVRGGAHGYDNQAPDMRALFIAHGPSFRAGATLADLDSVDIQPLLARLLAVQAPPGDGRAEDTAAAMRTP